MKHVHDKSKKRVWTEDEIIKAVAKDFSNIVKYCFTMYGPNPLEGLLAEFPPRKLAPKQVTEE